MGIKKKISSSASGKSRPNASRSPNTAPDAPIVGMIKPTSWYIRLITRIVMPAPMPVKK